MSRQLRALAEDTSSIQVQFLAPTLAGSQPTVPPVQGISCPLVVSMGACTHTCTYKHN